MMIMSQPLLDTLAAFIRLISTVRNAQRHVHQCTIFYAFQKENPYQLNQNLLSGSPVFIDVLASWQTGKPANEYRVSK
jgi:hypothetical protein